MISVATAPLPSPLKHVCLILFIVFGLLLSLPPPSSSKPLLLIWPIKTVKIQPSVSVSCISY